MAFRWQWRWRWRRWRWRWWRALCQSGILRYETDMLDSTVNAIQYSDREDPNLLWCMYPVVDLGSALYVDSTAMSKWIKIQWKQSSELVSPVQNSVFIESLWNTGVGNIVKFFRHEKMKYIKRTIKTDESQKLWNFIKGDTSEQDKCHRVMSMYIYIYIYM